VSIIDFNFPSVVGAMVCHFQPLIDAHLMEVVLAWQQYPNLVSCFEFFEADAAFKVVSKCVILDIIVFR